MRCILVAENEEMKEKWVEVVRKWLGFEDEEVQKKWLKSLLNLKEEEVKETKFKMEDLEKVMRTINREVSGCYVHYVFENIENIKEKKTTYKNTKIIKNLEYFSSMVGSKMTKKEEKHESTLELSWENFVEVFKTLVTPFLFQMAFNKIPGRRKKSNTLPSIKFHNFLKEVQKDKNYMDYVVLISIYEPVLSFSNLSIIGLTNYLMEEEGLIVDRNQLEDMDQPLSHYYISTSHNTYLTKDQLKSKSSVEMYVRALLKGCRCLELDCWDGPDNEPIIYHGFTLTSKILFKDVLHAINQHAFQYSEYPLILSIENHCSVDQQKIMANYLLSIFEDKLFTNEVQEGEENLPSPNQLKTKIIIKAKKIRENLPKESDSGKSKNPEENINDSNLTDINCKINEVFEDEEDEEEEEEDEDCIETEFLQEINKTDVDNFDLVSLTSNEDEVSLADDTAGLSDEKGKEEKKKKRLMLLEDFKKLNVVKSNASLSFSSTSSSASSASLSSSTSPHISSPSVLKKTKVKLKVAKEFSDLVVYCQSKRFKNFFLSKKLDKHFEMCSFGEKKATKLMRDEPFHFIEHNHRHLSRVYPAGYRFDSSNFNPVVFWNVGCQMVALNFQTPGKEMQLNQGLFQMNRGSGYVLKPLFLRQPKEESTNEGVEEVSFGYPIQEAYETLSIRIIGAYNLPLKHTFEVRSERNYLVQVRVFGVDEDNQVQTTSSVKNNGMNPIWDETFLFKIQQPQLALLLFTVCSKTFVAHFSFPYRAIKNGCRRVPLLDKYSEPIKESFLLVHVEHFKI